MINVIAHRGWWTTPAEQNTLAAFARAFDAGIGVELDVRDCDGWLAVSHDPPCFATSGCPLSFESVLNLLSDQSNILAVNVKSCGLAPWFAKLKAPKNWFFFDMADADEHEYRKLKLPILNSQDEHDSADNNLRISPEIFGSIHYESQWEHLQHMGGSIYLITDHPLEAMDFFK